MEYVAEAGQAAHEQLPTPVELTTVEERAKFKQARFEQWLSQQRRELKEGEAERVLDELEQLRTRMPEAASAVATMTKKLHYLHERRAMLAYATFVAQGYPIGSGSVESANKLVVQSRMKGAGMRWADRHVNAMLALRNLACNDRWETGWPAIRHGWQQEVQTKRRLRLSRAAATTAGDRSAPAEPIPQIPPPASVVTQHHTRTAVSDETRPAPTGQTGSHGTRPAATHPWRRAFLRRRPA